MDGGGGRRRRRDPAEAAVSALPAAVRSGPGYWWASYLAMLRFDITNLRTYLGFLLVIQLLVGAGMAYIYGFYLGEAPPAVELYIMTGIPALALVPLGMVWVPSLIGQHKLRDTYDFLWSLPVPRIVTAASTFTTFTLLALPGMAVSLWIAGLRYEVDLAVSWAIIPAVGLSSLMATSVGFGLGHLIPDPRVTNLITNVIVFFVLLFSPIVVPIELFPDWLAAIHRVLPFYPMATVIRDALTDGLVTGVGTAYLVLIAWTVGSWMAVTWVVTRRR
jgi:ABC-2 type transport system permease protein